MNFNNAQELGEFLIVIVFIVSAFLLIYRPLAKLNITIATLSLTIQGLNQDFEKHESANIKDFEEVNKKMRESNARQWTQIDKNKDNVTLLDRRVQTLEHKDKYNKKGKSK